MIEKMFCLLAVCTCLSEIINIENVLGMFPEDVQEPRPSVENVKNPFRLLTDSIEPNFVPLKNSLCDAFIKKVEVVKSKFTPLLEDIRSLNYELAEEWEQNAQLLVVLFNGIKTDSDVNEEYEKLVAVTNDGFAIRNQEAIFELENGEENILILDEFLQTLWQGREIAEYFRLISINEVSVAAIPQMLENMEQGLNSIGQIAHDFNIQFSKLSLLKCIVCKILGAYQYIEYGRVVNTPNNRKFLYENLEQYKNKELIDILLKPFSI